MTVAFFGSILAALVDLWRGRQQGSRRLHNDTVGADPGACPICDVFSRVFAMMKTIGDDRIDAKEALRS